MPPSDPEKPFDLPSHLATAVAQSLGAPNLSAFVTTISKRPSLKATASHAKLATIQGTIAVEASPFAEKSVLLIDDLYQSGVSLNYVAKLLLQAGASRVLGLSCEKTCRNDDNVTGARRSTTRQRFCYCWRHRAFVHLGFERLSNDISNTRSHSPIYSGITTKHPASYFRRTGTPPLGRAYRYRKCK
jgi:hypoxanthine phosphoribosyltransferase